MSRFSFMTILLMTALALTGTTSNAQEITPDAIKAAEARLAQRQAKHAGPATTESSTKPAVQFTFAGKKFDAVKAFGNTAILLEFTATGDVDRLEGNIVIKDLQGKTRGTIAVNQDVQFRSFTVRVDYDIVDPFLRWLKSTPIAEMQLSVEPTGSPATAETANAQKPAQDPLAPQAPPITKQPQKIAFVVDTSGTMQSQFGDIRTELKKAIRDLKDGQPFNVYMGGTNVVPLSKGFSSASKNSREASFNLIDETSPKEGSELDKAVIVACGYHPDLIWLITDGDISQEPETSALKMVEAAKASKTRINCVLNYTRDDRLQTLLARICNSTGGKCIDAEGHDVTTKLGSLPILAKPVPVKALPPDVPAGKSVFSDN